MDPDEHEDDAGSDADEPKGIAKIAQVYAVRLTGTKVMWHPETQSIDGLTFVRLSKYDRKLARITLGRGINRHKTRARVDLNVKWWAEVASLRLLYIYISVSCSVQNWICCYSLIKVMSKVLSWWSQACGVICIDCARSPIYIYMYVYRYLLYIHKAFVWFFVLWWKQLVSQRVCVFLAWCLRKRCLQSSTSSHDAGGCVRRWEAEAEDSHQQRSLASVTLGDCDHACFGTRIRHLASGNQLQGSMGSQSSWCLHGAERQCFDLRLCGPPPQPHGWQETKSKASSWKPQEETQAQRP